MGYRLANSDRRFADQPDEVVKTTERHYLKPPLNTEPPLDQRYGNVLIELVKENEEPRYLKVMVTTYHDRSYQPAQSFDAFLDALFTPPDEA